MNLWRWVSLGGLLAAAAVLVWLAAAVLLGGGKTEPAPAAAPGGVPPAGPMRATGFAYSRQLADGRMVRVEAGDIVQQARKLGPLSLRPVQELVLSDVRIRLQRLDAAPAPGGEAGNADSAAAGSLSIRELVGEMLRRRGGGTVSRIRIVGFDLVVEEGAGERLSLHSGAASWAGAAPEIRLAEGVQLRVDGQEALACREAEWDPARRELRVDGVYLFQGGGSPLSGSRGRFAFDPDTGVVSLTSGASRAP